MIMLLARIRPLHWASFHGILALFLLISLILAQVFSLPGPVSSTLSVVWIFYVPFGIGTLLLTSMNRRINDFPNYLERLNVGNILTTWLIGFLLIVSLSLPFFALGKVNIAGVLGSIFLVASTIPLIVPSFRPSLRRTNKIPAFSIILMVFVGLGFGLYVKSFSPFPLTPGFDLFAHIHVTKSLLYGSPDLDTLVYTPTFHTLVALGTASFKADLVQVFWTAPIFLFGVFSVSTYALIYRITKNSYCSFIGCLIGLAVTEKGFVPDMVYFYPSSLLMSFFPATFLVVDNLWQKTSITRKLRICFTFVIFLAIVSLHPYLGIVCIGALTLYLLVTLYVATKHLLFLIFRMCTIAIAIILLLYVFGYLDFQIVVKNIFDQRNQVSPSYLYSAEDNLFLLKSFYTEPMIVSSIIGMCALALSRDRKAVAIAFLASILLLLYFQQIAIIIRILPLERVLLAFSSATFFTLPILISGHFLSRISSKISFKSIHLRNPFFSYLRPYSIFKDPSVLYLIYTALIAMLLIPTLLGPYDKYIGAYIENRMPFSSYTYDELALARWIEKNTPADYLVLSDPLTVLEMRGLAFRENIEAIGWNLTVAKSVRSILMSNNASEAHDRITSEFGENVLIVVTPRTSEWLKLNTLEEDRIPPHSQYFLDVPVDEFDLFKGFTKFFNNSYFELVKRVNDSFVFIPVRS